LINPFKFKITRKYNKIKKNCNFLSIKSLSKKLIAFFIAVQSLGLPNVIASEKYNSDKDALKYSENLTLDYLNNTSNFNYIIDKGDTLSVIASREYPELDAIVTVDNEGTIYLPRLKRIYVAGLTVDELIPLLNKAYKKFINFPAVELDITEFRHLEIYVRGEVNNPGIRVMKIKNNIGDIKSTSSPVLIDPLKTIDSFPFFNKTNNYNNYISPTVFEALKMSGGITSYSDLENIVLIRKDTKTNGGGKIKTSLNLKKFLQDGDSSHNLNLYDKDEIIVKKLEEPDEDILGSAVLSELNSKYIKIFVVGRVNNPGYVTVFKTSTLNDAIAFAGGTKFLKGPIQYLTFKNDGTIDKRKFRFSRRNRSGSYKNPFLKDGDLIVVGNSPFSLTAEVINEITSPFQGIYSTYKLIEAFND